MPPYFKSLNSNNGDTRKWNDTETWSRLVDSTKDIEETICKISFNF